MECEKTAICTVPSIDTPNTKSSIFLSSRLMQTLLKFFYLFNNYSEKLCVIRKFVGQFKCYISNKN